MPIKSSYDLEIAIKSYNTRYAEIWDFATLHKLFVDIKPQESLNFFDEVLPKLINLALQLPDVILIPIPLLKQNECRSISMSQMQAACLLANAFLCTFPLRNTDKRNSEFASYPKINFNKLYGCKGQTSVEKIKCLIHYFRRILCSEMPTGVITFQRRYLEPFTNWQSSDVPLSRTKFQITSKGKIEDGHGMLQVDFANRFVGGGVLGNGCVQEEIRFLTNPEMIVSRLFTESLTNDEALIMIGCEQFNVYRGYSSSFRWGGNFVDQTPSDAYRRRMTRVVAIDAIPYKNNSDQFREWALKRELHKAFVGFSSDGPNDKSPVATGLWGCGAFNGYSIRSALIQFIACAENQRNVIFFTWDDEKTKREIADIFEFLVEKKVTVGELFKCMKNYWFSGNRNDPTQLVPSIKSQLATKTTANLNSFVIPKKITTESRLKTIDSYFERQKQTTHKNCLESSTSTNYEAGTSREAGPQCSFGFNERKLLNEPEDFKIEPVHRSPPPLRAPTSQQFSTQPNKKSLNEFLDEDYRPKEEPKASSYFVDFFANKK